MEIINLLLVSIGYYFIYYLEFYQKVILLFTSSMFISLLTNHKIIENKSNDPDGNKLIYFILNTIIQFIFFCYNCIIHICNKIFEIKFVNECYNYVKKINQYYLIGRNQIIQKFSGILFSTFVSMPQHIPCQSQTQLSNNSSTQNKKNVFRDSNDMNNFLDSLVDKKTD